MVGNWNRAIVSGRRRNVSWTGFGTVKYPHRIKLGQQELPLRMSLSGSGISRFLIVSAPSRCAWMLWLVRENTQCVHSDSLTIVTQVKAGAAVGKAPLGLTRQVSSDIPMVILCFIAQRNAGRQRLTLDSIRLHKHASTISTRGVPATILKSLTIHSCYEPSLTT